MDRDWERIVTFYGFPKERWQHVRTTNSVASPFSPPLFRTDAARRFKKIENVLALLWKVLPVTERRFRRLNASDLMRDVHDGAKYGDGIKIVESSEEALA